MESIVIHMLNGEAIKLVIGGVKTAPVQARVKLIRAYEKMIFDHSFDTARGSERIMVFQKED